MGGLNGIYLIIGTFIKSFFNRIHLPLEQRKITRLISIIVTFSVTCLAWVFFRANTTQDAFDVLSKMLHPYGKLFIPTGADVIAPIYAVLAITLLLLIEAKHEYFNNKFSFFNNKSEMVRLISYAGLIALILFFGVFDGGQFIYFQF